MVRTVFGKVMWVGRATIFMVGLAVMLALMFGVASTALGANGGNFVLGSDNAATLVTKLSGAVRGASLQLINTSNNAAATALDLQVKPGKPPLTVNAAAGKATNLNADKVDGKEAADFYSVGSKVADSSHADQADQADNATSAQNATNADNANTANSATNADMLDGVDSTGFVQGNGRVYQNRIEPPLNYTGQLMFAIPGLGTVTGGCHQTNGAYIFFRNESGGDLAAFIDNGGVDPALSIFGNGSGTYLTSSKVGNDLITMQVGRGANQKLATIIASSHWNSSGCAIEAMAVAQG